MLLTMTAALLLAAWLPPAVGTPAAAQINPVASGRRCSALTVTDPTAGEQVQTGQTKAGPIVAATAGADISITCAIHVGAANSTHAGFDEATATSAPTTQVAALAPTAISHVAPEGQPVYQCTEVTVNGTTWYWDATITNPGGTPEVAAGWTTSSSALCNKAISQEIFPGPFTPVLDILIPILDAVFEEIDNAVDPSGQEIDTQVCPILASLAGSDAPPVLDIRTDGDVYVAGEWIWDCPEYGTSGTLSPTTPDGSGDAAVDDDHPESVWIVCAGSNETTVCV